MSFRDNWKSRHGGAWEDRWEKGLGESEKRQLQHLVGSIVHIIEGELEESNSARLGELMSAVAKTWPEADKDFVARAFEHAVKWMQQEGKVTWSGGVVSTTSPRPQAPDTPAQVETLNPVQRQTRIDALLDRWSKEPEKRPQIEEQLKSLRAFRALLMIRRASNDEQKLLRELTCTVIGSDTGTTNEAVLPTGTVVGVQPWSNDHTIFFYSPFYSRMIVRGKVMRGNQYSAPVQDFRAATDIGYGEGTGYEHGPECFCDECMAKDDMSTHRCPTCGSRECPGDGHSIDCRKPGTMTLKDVPTETRDSLLDKFNRGEIDEATLRRRMKQLHSSLRARWMARRADDINLFHGTTKQFDEVDTERGELGSHWGTPEQANEVLDEGGNLDTEHLEPKKRDKHLREMRHMRVIPADIDIKNPLRLVDKGHFDPHSIADQLIRLGIITQEQWDDGIYLLETWKDQNRVLQAAIVNAGYDGVVYLNRREGIGDRVTPDGMPPFHDMDDEKVSDEVFLKYFPQAHDSYIVFEPTQIKERWAARRILAARDIPSGHRVILDDDTRVWARASANQDDRVPSIVLPKGTSVWVVRKFRLSHGGSPELLEIKWIDESAGGASGEYGHGVVRAGDFGFAAGVGQMGVEFDDGASWSPFDEPRKAPEPDLPETPADVPGMKPAERQMKIDALLDRWNKEPEKRPQIEEQLKSLRAFRALFMVKRAAGESQAALIQEVLGQIMESEIASSGIANKATDFTWTRTTIDPKKTNWGPESMETIKGWLDTEESDYLSDMGEPRVKGGNDAKRQAILNEPVIVVTGDDGILWVLDGNHRVVQSLIWGYGLIPALVGVKKPGVGRTPVSPDYKIAAKEKPLDWGEIESIMAGYWDAREREDWAGGLDCTDDTNHLQEILMKAGYPMGDWCSGYYKMPDGRRASHDWLELGGKVLDITHGQFEKPNFLITDVGDPRYLTPEQAENLKDWEFGSVRSKWLQRRASLPELPAEEHFSPEVLDKIRDSNDALWADTVEAMALKAMPKLQEWNRALWDEGKAAEAVARAYGTGDVKVVYETPIMKAVLDQVVAWMKNTGGERQSLLSAWIRRAYDPHQPWGPGNPYMNEGKLPAAACDKCGGWSDHGGMSQFRNDKEPTLENLGRPGCSCADKGAWMEQGTTPPGYVDLQDPSGAEVNKLMRDWEKRKAEGADPAAGPFKSPWPDQIQAFMQAVYDQTQAHPFTSGQRIWDGEVIIRVHPWAGGPDREYPWIISLQWIQAMTPGKGHARRCLQWLTALADEYGVFMELEAKPTGTHKIPKKKLINLYEDVGFESKDQPADMVRNPLQAAWRARRAAALDPDAKFYRGESLWFRMTNWPGKPWAEYFVLGTEGDQVSISSKPPSQQQANAEHVRHSIDELDAGLSNGSIRIDPPPDRGDTDQPSDMSVSDVPVMSDKQRLEQIDILLDRWEKEPKNRAKIEQHLKSLRAFSALWTVRQAGDAAGRLEGATPGEAENIAQALAAEVIIPSLKEIAGLWAKGDSGDGGAEGLSQPAKLNVNGVWFVGSRAGGTAGRKSDWDFAVTFTTEPAPPEGDTTSIRELEDSLARALRLASIRHGGAGGAELFLDFFGVYGTDPSDAPDSGMASKDTGSGPVIRVAAAHDPAYSTAVKALCQAVTGKPWLGAESFPSLENFVLGGQSDGVIYFDGGYTRVLLDPREAEAGRMVLKVAEIAKKSAANWEAALPQRQALEKIAEDHFRKITGGERQSLLRTWKKRADAKHGDESDRGHDYDFGWDYEVQDKPDAKLVAMCEAIAADLMKTLVPKLGMFGGFEIGYLENSGSVAVFIASTSSYPMIGIDLPATKAAMAEFPENYMAGALRTSIVHELAHAIQEFKGMPYGEEEAENFARDFEDGVFTEFWKKKPRRQRRAARLGFAVCKLQIKKANDPIKKVVEIAGVKVGIEWPKGTIRTWDHLPNNDYRVKMKADYGYIRGTEGDDGEEVDVYAGPNRESTKVFVVEQLKDSGAYDEEKYMLGYDDLTEAKNSYLDHMDKEKMGSVKAVSWEKFLKLVPKSQKKEAEKNLKGERQSLLNTWKRRAAGAEALILVHIDSLDVMQAEEEDLADAKVKGADTTKASELAGRLASAVHGWPGPVYVISQGWATDQGGGSISPKETLGDVIMDTGAKWIQFDESESEWSTFLPQLLHTLKSDGVGSAVIAGLWWEPKADSGCAHAVYKYLAKVMPVSYSEQFLGQPGKPLASIKERWLQRRASSNPDLDMDLFNFQDSQIEPLPKTLWNDFPECNELGIRLENAGDIFRELVWRDYPDPGYIGEKVEKIRRALTRPQMGNDMSPGALAVMGQIASLFESLDLAGKSPVLIAARDLNIALARQDFGRAATLLTVFDQVGQARMARRAGHSDHHSWVLNQCTGCKAIYSPAVADAPCPVGYPACDRCGERLSMADEETECRECMGQEASIKNRGRKRQSLFADWVDRRAAAPMPDPIDAGSDYIAYPEEISEPWQTKAWITPNGLFMSCGNENHEDYADGYGKTIDQMILDGWIRVAVGTNLLLDMAMPPNAAQSAVIEKLMQGQRRKLTIGLGDSQDWGEFNTYGEFDADALAAEGKSLGEEIGRFFASPEAVKREKDYRARIDEHGYPREEGIEQESISARWLRRRAAGHEPDNRSDLQRMADDIFAYVGENPRADHSKIARHIAAKWGGHPADFEGAVWNAVTYLIEDERRLKWDRQRDQWVQKAEPLIQMPPAPGSKPVSQVMGDLPVVDPDAEKDRLLDEFSKGTLTQTDLDSKLKRLQASAEEAEDEPDLTMEQKVQALLYEIARDSERAGWVPDYDEVVNEVTNFMANESGFDADQIDQKSVKKMLKSLEMPGWMSYDRTPGPGEGFENDKDKKQISTGDLNPIQDLPKHLEEEGSLRARWQRRAGSKLDLLWRRWTKDGDPKAKAAWHSEAARLLKDLAAELQLAEGSYDLRSNKAGSAVMGEVTLHSDDVYVQISGSGLSPGREVLYRLVSGRGDYSGMANNYMSFDEVERPASAAAKVKALLAKKGGDRPKPSGAKGSMTLETERGARYEINNKGEIIRLDMKDFQPSGQWRLVGVKSPQGQFFSFNDFGKLPKNVSGWSVVDYDHGSERVWGEKLRAISVTGNPPWENRPKPNLGPKPKVKPSTGDEIRMVENAIIDLLRRGPNTISTDLHEILEGGKVYDYEGSPDAQFIEMVSSVIGRMIDRGMIIFDGSTAEFSLLKDPEPTTPEHLPEMSNFDRQTKVDSLLDQMNTEKDPAKRKQIEQRLRSLRASVRVRLIRSAGYQDWSSSFLFDPVENPIPFPKAGQSSGLWGRVYKTDLDELWFLVDNTRELHDVAWRLFKENPEVADQGLIALTPVIEHPEVIPFLKKAFNRINEEYVYPTWGKQAPEAGHEDDPFYSGEQWKGQAKAVVRILQGVYGGDRGMAELEKFLSRLKPGEREDFLEEAGRSDFAGMMSGFQEVIDRQRGTTTVKPSRKTEMTSDDAANFPEVDVAAQTDQLLEQLQNETDPEKRKQIERRLRSLKASDFKSKWQGRRAQVLISPQTKYKGVTK